MENKKNKYSLEFKLKALEFVCQRGDLLSVVRGWTLAMRPLKIGRKAVIWVMKPTARL